MRDWLPYREVFLQRLIELEGPQGKRTCAVCLLDWSAWRCIDCFGHPSLCTHCCQTRHQADYLHKVERWVPEGTPAWIPDAAMSGTEEAEALEDRRPRDEEPDEEDAEHCSTSPPPVEGPILGGEDPALPLLPITSSLNFP